MTDRQTTQKCCMSGTSVQIQPNNHQRWATITETKIGPTTTRINKTGQTTKTNETGQTTKTNKNGQIIGFRTTEITDQITITTDQTQVFPITN